MPQPLVSIVIPVYNGEKYLSPMIDSILSQSYRNFELFLINDGSIDSSLQICNNLAKKDLRITVINQTNQGPSVARNIGISRSHGKYILFFDADDFVEPQMVAVLVESAEKNSVDLVICGAYLEIVKKGKIQSFKISEPSTIIKSNNAVRTYYVETMLKSSIYTLWNKLYKLNIINQFSIHFDPSINFGEDLIFNLDYIHHTESLSMLSRCYYHYFQRDICETLSSKCRSDKARIMNLWHNRLVEFVNGLSDEYLISKVNWLKYRWLLSCFISQVASSKSLSEKRIYIKNLLKNENFVPASRKLIGNQKYIIEKIVSTHNITLIYLLAWSINIYKIKFSAKYLEEKDNG